ncbi:Hemin transport system permease protein HmuU [Austwickia sp. TVS 96-490-7B]|uniref:FecCD family ABC transporter permease n=1 Tax=Austwickia sp. TVS 96-490-7B TaxID=2830843 RepID=UPI001D42F4FC|nr:iron ABC transporter permease [Austwickia sp. TVS 96-490-7B]MBW3085473.1 Hemin transport system permease protein HmuU [Austwickia sp. TVS 96-490-7B]
MRKSPARVWTVTVGLVIVTVVMGVLALGAGAVAIPADRVVQVVLRRTWLIDGAQVGAIDDRIVWELRLPRVIAAVAVGAVLAQCGTVLQSVTRNDLADPYLLGISSGASVGAVAAVLNGWSLPGAGPVGAVTLAAFVGAIAGLLAVLALATGRAGDLPTGRTVLAGVAVAQVAGAIVSFAIMVLADHDTARLALSWTFGSFTGVRAGDAVALMVLAVLTTVGVTGMARTLDAFAFGEVTAQALGVDVRRTRWALLVGCALAAAGTVALVGPIGFVGLTVPHILRVLIGPGHAALLPASAVGGALLLLVADTVARTVASGQEIPVGVVTSLIGAPVLAVLLRRRARA